MSNVQFCEVPVPDILPKMVCKAPTMQLELCLNVRL
jgi:hypothetical protein